MRLFWMAGVQLQGGLLAPPDLSCGAGGGFKRRAVAAPPALS